MTDDAKPLNILALDGGGVRGLSSLLILRHLMEQLATRLELETAPRPCEVFDLICGTSTGGLIALMLGRLRMDVQQAIECYLDFSSTVFKEKSTDTPQPLWKGLWKSASQMMSASEGRDERSKKGSEIYDASILEGWVKKIVEAREGDGLAPLEDPLAKKGGCCHTFVVAVTRVFADSPPKIFRSYPTKSRPADPYRIWEAARATTAASPFFRPMTMGVPPQTFIDGGLSGANNPSQLAVVEAREMFDGRSIGCLLSLGTGVPDVIAVKGDLAKIQEACHKLITSCERVHDSVGKDFRTKAAGVHADPYFRFSVDRGLGNIALDEWNRVEDLTGITDGYMRSYLEEAKAEACVDVLMARATEVATKQEEETIT